MPIILVSNGENIDNSIKQYYLDTPEDIANLPKNVSPGSCALIISNGEIYILNSSREWVKFE